MKTYRNLSYTLCILTIATLVVVVFLSTEELGKLGTALYNVSVSVAAASLVVLIVSIFMFFHSRGMEIMILRRRGSRVYSELLEHKMRLIEVMDEERPLSDWENFLYNPEEFPRTRKFLHEEYFLLLSYEPYIQSHATGAVCAFHELHKELETFMRTVLYDTYDYTKFRKLFIKENGHDLAPDTTEAELTASPKLEEAYEALLSANEYALQTVEGLLRKTDCLMTELDSHFRAGIHWAETKKGFDSEFKMWMSSKS